MWGSSVDERKLTRERSNRASNQWHREQPEGGAVEEEESRGSGEENGTWGERDVGGFTTARAMQDYEVRRIICLFVILYLHRELTYSVGPSKNSFRTVQGPVKGRQLFEENRHRCQREEW